MYHHILFMSRFVNHMTEKAQTKAVAQPVHLVAREVCGKKFLMKFVGRCFKVFSQI